MTTAGALDRGRQAFEAQAWSEAYAQLHAADQEAPLEPDDLLSLALASILTGRDEESDAVLARAHEQFLARGEIARAAQSAIWLGMSLVNALEIVRGSAWIARAERLLDDSALDCVERGWLLLPRARQLLDQGDVRSACGLFEQAQAIATRFGDRDLRALSGLGVGVSRVYAGGVQDGLTFLDDVMTAIEAREVTPRVAGIVYCGVIDVCQEVFDLRRAHEWTGAMQRWCASQPDLVPFRGVCEVHRAQIIQMRGDWSEALEIARIIASGQPRSMAAAAIGPAHYRLAEIYRLRGDYVRADEAYRRASRNGYRPEPGLALMRMAQGQVEGAAAAIKRALDEAVDGPLRSRLLPAYVEIMLATREVELAQGGVEELARIAVEHDVLYLRACAAMAQGAVLLARGEHREALAALREACAEWQELGAPYEVARTREMLATACHALGDQEHCELELDAAAWAYRQLGAAPDLARVSPRRERAEVPGGLSTREVEVLRLIAAGKTNRAIAEELVLSEKTVARHVSNIFTKLRVASRAAATAYAYEHDLVTT